MPAPEAAAWGRILPSFLLVPLQSLMMPANALHGCAKTLSGAGLLKRELLAV